MKPQFILPASGLVVQILAVWNLLTPLAHGENAPPFEREVLPILYHHCFSCHSEKQSKPKGGLRLDSVQGIQKSDVLQPGHPEQSDLLARTLLPIHHEDVMPPLKGGAQPLSETERDVLRRWIAAGADFGGWTRFNHRGDAFQSDAPITQHKQLTAIVDQLVAKHHEINGTTLNAPVNDEGFLRRAYLDVIGRIPSLDESTRFLEVQDPNKRARLIDELLASPGFTSHFFNWKADQLRLHPIEGQPGWLYDEWVKNAIRSHTSYDAFVRELITASGYLWDNGAVGFYVRDLGMPLDHMSNLSRLFLGTRIECAQCHDHPLQPVTQRDFFQMAAFTFGVSNLESSTGYSASSVKQWPALKEKLDSIHADTGLRQSVSRTVSFLKRLTTDTGKPLLFPETYAYDKSLRKTPVPAETLFGDPIGDFSGSPREPFAQWLTSPRNPRFTKSIANRLWKFVLGTGLIEPVDSLSALPEPQHAELLQSLTEGMTGMGYDERSFLSALLNSRLYQSESVRETPLPSVSCDLRGPLLRRLSAEQIWDSCLTLIVPDLDQRGSLRRTEGSYLDPERLRRLSSMSADELIERARDEKEYRERQREFTLLQAKQSKEVAAALAERNSDKAAALKAAHARENAAFYSPRLKAMAMGAGSIAKETDPRWQKLPPHLLRSSEIPIPLPTGHFLRQFGKSDRREIDAFNRDPNATHSLALMNGELTERILAPGSHLQNLLAAGSRDGETTVQLVYRALLVRSATEAELALLARLNRDKPVPTTDLLWALMNSPEFLFQH